MNEEEQQIVNNIVSLKTASENDRATFEEKVRDWYEMRNGKLKDANNYQWRSRVFVPELQKAFDTVHPIYLDMLFSQQVPFKVKGIDGAADDRQAAILNSLMKVYIDKMGFYNEMSSFLEELLTIGTSFGKLFWEKKTITYDAEEEVRTEGKSILDIPQLGINLRTSGKKEKKKVKKIKVVKDAPSFKWISWKDIFFSSRATNIDDTWLIHRTYSTLEQLKQKNAVMFERGLPAVYKNLNEVEMKIKHTEEGDRGDLGEHIARNLKIDRGLQESGEAKAQNLQDAIDLNEYSEIEILEFWSQDGQKVQVVAGGLVLIRNAKNEFNHKKKPFLMSNYETIPGQLYGRGICEKAEDSVDYLNTVTNQSIDNNTLANNIMLAVSKSSGVSMENTKSRPGGVIYFDDDDDSEYDIKKHLHQFKLEKIDTTVEQAIARKDIQEITGANKFLQGTFDSGAVRSGVQSRQMMNAGGKKFSGKVLTYESMFLKPFVSILYSLIQQFMNTNQIVKVLGQRGAKYINVRPEDICLDLDFIPVGSRQLIEMEMLVHQLQNLLAISSRLPFAQSIVNFRYLIQKIVENMGFDQDEVQKMVLTEKEAQQALMQLIAVQQLGGKGSEKSNGTQPNTGGGEGQSGPNLGGGANG